MTETKERITSRIAHRLKAARCFRGLEPNELAARAGISQRKVERYEATGNLTCDDLERLAAALRLPVSHFLEGCILCDDSKENPSSVGDVEGVGQNYLHGTTVTVPN